jgi:hypothetical protein
MWSKQWQLGTWELCQHLLRDSGKPSKATGVSTAGRRIHTDFYPAVGLTKLGFNPLKPSGYYMYRQFNIQQFYVLPTQCIYVFCVDVRKKWLFPYTALTDWFL